VALADCSKKSAIRLSLQSWSNAVPHLLRAFRSANKASERTSEGRVSGLSIVFLLSHYFNFLFNLVVHHFTTLMFVLLPKLILLWQAFFYFSRNIHVVMNFAVTKTAESNTVLRLEASDKVSGRYQVVRVMGGPPAKEAPPVELLEHHQSP